MHNHGKYMSNNSNGHELMSHNQYRNLHGRRYLDLPLLTDKGPFDLADAIQGLLELSQKLPHVSSQRAYDICYNSMGLLV